MTTRVGYGVKIPDFTVYDNYSDFLPFLYRNKLIFDWLLLRGQFQSLFPKNEEEAYRRTFDRVYDRDLVIQAYIDMTQHTSLTDDYDRYILISNAAHQFDDLTELVEWMGEPMLQVRFNMERRKIVTQTRQEAKLRLAKKRELQSKTRTTARNARFKDELLTHVDLCPDDNDDAERGKGYRSMRDNYQHIMRSPWWHRKESLSDVKESSC